MHKFIIFILLLLTFNVWSQVPSPTPFVKPVPAKNSGVTDWEVLLGLDLKTGKADAKVEKILGKKIKLLGFMVPLDYDDRSIKEFMLLPTPLSCTHVPPPPQNQIILVKMKKGTKGAYFWGPVYTEGIITAAKKDKNMTEVPSYEMVGESIVEYKATDGSVKVHNN
ncbi:MAG: DUF3299 domain-containing protein [Bacteriovoracaceae bacterium]